MGRREREGESWLRDDSQVEARPPSSRLKVDRSESRASLHGRQGRAIFRQFHRSILNS